MPKPTEIFCREHPEAILIEDYHAGDMVCPECGLVVGDRIVDVGSEWRTFSNDKDTKDASRVGSSENPLLDGSDLSTMIAQPSGSNQLMGEDGRPLYHNRRQMSSSDRNLINAFREIQQMADRLNLPKMISDRASTLFKQVYVSKGLKGRSNEAIAAACSYIACRQDAVPRSFKECRAKMTSSTDEGEKTEFTQNLVYSILSDIETALTSNAPEICAVTKVSRKDIAKVYKLILKTLETNLELITSEDFMSRFCSNLGLSSQVQRAATHIARKAVDLYLVPSRNPISVAAAAIYMASQASDDKRSHKEIGDIAGVAEVTIRQSYKLMYPKICELFPEDFNFDTSIEQMPSQ